jgi:hypothetical protein
MDRTMLGRWHNRRRGAEDVTNATSELAATRESIDGARAEIAEANRIEREKTELLAELVENQRRLLAAAEGEEGRIMAWLVALMNGRPLSPGAGPRA